MKMAGMDSIDNNLPVCVGRLRNMSRDFNRWLAVLAVLHNPKLMLGSIS
jgi:hypothetical protein